MAEKMTPKERELWDARADEEAWGFTLQVLEPWSESARAIGHDELTLVMDRALEETKAEHDRALKTLEALLERRSGRGAS